MKYFDENADRTTRIGQVIEDAFAIFIYLSAVALILVAVLR